MTEAPPTVLSLTLTGAHHGDRPVLGPLSLSLDRGDTLALCGPSGIGKSTLLRIIAGLHGGYDGTRQVTGRLAMVFQEPTLLPWRDVLRNVTLLSGCSTEEAREILAEVGLSDRSDAYPGALSLGQQRRLSLARAVAARPDLLLLDEPFVSLDPDLVQEMIGLVDRLRQSRGFALILVTHAEAEAKRLAARCLRLDGTPASLAAA